MATLRRFTYKDEKSDKFWEIGLEGAAFTVRFGRTGTAGQAQTKSFASPDEARKAAEKLVAEKVRGGYVEAAGAAAAPADALLARLRAYLQQHHPCPGFELPGGDAVAWFDGDAQAASRCRVFGQDGAGSLYAFWRAQGPPDEEAAVVYLAHEGEGSRVVARDLRGFLIVLATGAEEPGLGPEGVEVTGELRAFRKWLAGECGISLPSGQDEIEDASWREQDEGEAAHPEFAPWLAGWQKERFGDAAAAAAPASAPAPQFAPDPPWAQEDGFVKVLGAKKKDAAFVEHLQAVARAAGLEGGDAAKLTRQLGTKGVEHQFEGGRLVSIFLTAGCPVPLPGGLAFGDSEAQIAAKLGRPGPLYPNRYDYEGFALSCDAKGGLKMVTLMPADKAPGR